MSDWHYHKCPQCGAMTLAKDDKSGCPKCAKLHKIPRDIVRKAPNLNYVDPESLVIEYDPIPIYEGGLRKGAIIPRMQAECMCILGTFSEGTIIRDKNNNKFQVCADFSGRQRLLPLTQREIVV